ncbi:GAP family protein [Dietzia sp. ANT_WB102]|uniref:GAP family protein n=1 Tax=Dietzia sp. ANT_WB102 TaxID=2597345 RepID=UPI0011EE4B6C|nr:GAP family protein [Dietzia sp. ANT_WB102]KAA0918397.1 GAP family protein [Dietzia sp. ANT_WB102]
MLSVIGQTLGNAAGIAISPVPIIALILLLFSTAAARNSLAFMFGWILGITFVTAVVLAVGVQSSSGGGSTAGGIVKILIGLLFLALAVKQWRSRPAAGKDAAMPGWMASIDSVGAAKAVGMGLVFSAVNPKNLGLTVAAAATINGTGLSTGKTVGAAAVFVVISSLAIIGPVVGYLIAGEKATPVLTTMKQWLVANNATVMTVLFIVLGAKLFGDGLALVA